MCRNLSTCNRKLDNIVKIKIFQLKQTVFTVLETRRSIKHVSAYLVQLSSGQFHNKDTVHKL
jgi:hypothetical protein